MQIISNNCLGGFIYRFLNKEFNNPFIWSLILNPYFEELIENLKTINYNDFTLNKSTKKLDTFNLLINNKIKLDYIHYHFNENFNKPTICDKYGKPDKTGVDVYYNKIWEYIVEKYLNRLNRMDLNDDICIVVEDTKEHRYNINKIIDIVKKCNYKLILITNQYIEKNINNKMLILKHPTDLNSPHNCMLTYKKQILNFLK